MQSLIVASHMQSSSQTRDILFYTGKKGYPSGSNGKESAGNAGDPALILWKGEKECGRAIVDKQSIEGMGGLKYGGFLICPLVIAFHWLSS